MSIPGRLLLMAVALGAGIADAQARIESFSPTGYTKDARQVTVRFSAPMVALGDPDRSRPFVVRCAVPGTGRWIDERNWVYDFEYDVPGAQTCRFTLRRGVRTLAGERIAAPRQHTFHTGGPSILEHAPRRTIDERQVILLALDADADADSIRRHVRCHVAGQAESVGVDLVEEAERTEIFDALASSYYYPLRDLRSAAATHLPPGGDAARELQRIVMLRCREVLPSGGDVDLVWGAGVAGTNGVSGVDGQSIPFDVRAFRATLDCETRGGACLPLPMGISFSLPMPGGAASYVRLLDPLGREMVSEFDDGPEIRRIDFPGPFHENRDYRVVLTDATRDVDGRPLLNAERFPLTVRPIRLPTGATFGGHSRTVEARYGAAPVLLRRPAAASIPGRLLRVDNDHDIVAWMRRIAVQMRDDSHGWPASTASTFAADEEATPFELPVAKPDAAFQIGRVPLPGAGYHVVELDLPWRQGGPGGSFVAAGILATGLAVHFQHGRESSLVWVSRLQDATPVARAEVAITDACTGRALWTGRSDASGIAKVPRQIPSSECPGFGGRHLVSARTQGDLGLVLGEPRHRPNESPFRAHTVLDRSVYQPGEAVMMKHVLRQGTSAGFALPPGLPRSATVALRHRGSSETYSHAIDLDATGTAVSEFELPKTSKLGIYGIEIQYGEENVRSGEFRVERFAAATTKAAVIGPDKPLIRPSSLPLTLSVKHLAGGGAAYQTVNVRTRLELHDERSSPDPEERTASVALDAHGEAPFVVGNLPALGADARAMLEVEFDYRDGNGRLATASNWFVLWPAAILLYVDRGPPGERRVRIAALDVDYQPVPEQHVSARLFSSRDHRRTKRLLGGFHVLTYGRDRRFESECAGVTDADGYLLCDVPEHVADDVVVEATAVDEDGHVVRVSGWGGDYRRDRDEEIPELTIEVSEDGPFAPGESVPLSVAVPFAEAWALVSVHREGVLDAFVTRLRGSLAEILVPVRRNYAPNVAISVLVVGGRADRTMPAWLDDEAAVFEAASAALASYPPLGADGPDARNGTVSVGVTDVRHRLKVDVAPDRDTYRIRETARGRIRVTDPAGHPASNAEVALVALDDGVARMWRHRSWDIAEGMMRWRESEVIATNGMGRLRAPLEVASLAGGKIGVFNISPLGDVVFEQAMVAGENYERVVAPESSSAHSEASIRKDLDHLVLWRGRVAVGDDGAVEVDVPLNDLVTSFRLVAVATAGVDLFGTGEATIRTTQDLVLHAGLPAKIREGDRFAATFTVRNATDAGQTVSVVAEAAGVPKLARRTVALAAGESKEVAWRVTVPSGIDELTWDLTARSVDSTDRLAARQTVARLVPVRVQQATLVQLDSPLTLPVERPRKALPDRGGIAVALKDSVVGGLDSMREHMRRYPYTCLEQRVSAAVATGESSHWSALMEEVGNYADYDGLLKYFPVEWLRGSPILTAYVLTIADAAGYDVLDVHRERMIVALQRYLVDKIKREPDSPDAAPSLARMIVLAALARHGAAEPGMLDRFDPVPELLPTSALLDWIDTLARIAPERADLDLAKAILRSRLNYQGTTFGFSTESRDRLWWHMVSTDGNAARAVVSLLDDPDWRADMPRMIRGLFGRQQFGRWQTTVANAWGAVAASRFASAFEADPITGTTVVRFGDTTSGLLWTDGEPPVADGALEPVEIPWSGAGLLSLDHDGTGSPWALVEMRAAVPSRRGAERGYRIARSLAPVIRQRSRTWHRGDVAQVVLAIDADADMTWVVVEDPLPPGAVVLGSGLEGDSSRLVARSESGDGWPVFIERGIDSYRAYYRYVPKGRMTLRYNVRYNTAGTFRLPPTRVEAMYAPEMHAERPLAPITIK